jgi:hypothetical protein
MGTNRQRGPIARRADEPQDLVRRLSGIARTQRKGKDESRRRPVRRNGIAKLCWRPPAGPRSARPSRNATAPKRRRSTTRSRRGGRRLVENTPCRRGRRPACADSGHHRQSGQDATSPQPYLETDGGGSQEVCSQHNLRRHSASFPGPARADRAGGHAGAPGPASSSTSPACICSPQCAQRRSTWLISPHAWWR